MTHPRGTFFTSKGGHASHARGSGGGSGEGGGCNDPGYQPYRKKVLPKVTLEKDLIRRYSIHGTVIKKKFNIRGDIQSIKWATDGRGQPTDFFIVTTKEAKAAATAKFKELRERG